jgi:peptidoglycan/LPS O-acetylase OafA/YrhL
VSWSLCVEEHFYLFLPLIILAIMRWPRLRVVVAIVAAFELLAVVCRFATFTGVEWTPQQTHMRCDGLFIGMFFAWVAIHRPRYWAWLGRAAPWAFALGVAGTAIVMATIPSHPTAWTYVFVPTIATWTLALFFFPCVHESSVLSRINFYGLQYLGELTYAIYLVHNVLPRAWLGGHAAEGGLRGLLVRVGLVGGASVLLHHVVERPAMRLRQHVLNRWRAEPRVVAVAAGTEST